MSVDQILLIIAAIAFALAAFGVTIPRVSLNLVAVGLFCFVVSLLI
jgi:hypothetical protein